MAESYLAKQKEQLRLLVKALEDELDTVESSDERTELVNEWFKELWRFCEEGYKTSFRNGVAQSGRTETNGSKERPKVRRFANWQKKASTEEDR